MRCDEISWFQRRAFIVINFFHRNCIIWSLTIGFNQILIGRPKNCTMCQHMIGCKEIERIRRRLVIGLSSSIATCTGLYRMVAPYSLQNEGRERKKIRGVDLWSTHLVIVMLACVTHLCVAIGKWSHGPNPGDQAILGVSCVPIKKELNSFTLIV